MLRRKVRLKITASSRQAAGPAGERLRTHCPACGREVEALTTGQAAEILEVGADELSGLVAAGLIHAIRTVNGVVRVCKESLFTQ